MALIQFKLLFLFVLLLTCNWAEAQNNYFVSDHLLSNIKANNENSYVGIDVNNNLIQLDSNFNYQWGLGNFYGTLVDFTINPVSRQIFTLSLVGSDLYMSKINEDGSVVEHQLFDAAGRIYSARIEPEINGFVIALIGEFGAESDLKSILITRINNSFETIWTRGIHALPERVINNIDLTVNYEEKHIILLTGQADDGDIKSNTLSKYDFEGTNIWSRQFGGDCVLYHDLEELNSGEIVIIGQHEEYEYQGDFKVSICDAEGILLSTKQQNYSDVDQGTHNGRLVVLSDNRYAISIHHYYGGCTGCWEGRILFFDNHKPAGMLYYRPFPYEISPDVYDFNIWGVDANDRILLTSETGDYAEGGVDKLMGRLTWGEISCDLGEYTENPDMYYRKEASIDVFLKTYNFSLNFIPHEQLLEPRPFTSAYYCSTNPADGGSNVSEDHLWSYDPDEWPVVCDMTVYEAPDVGIEHQFSTVNSNISIYPNPTKGLLTINGVAKGRIEIYTIDGKQLETISLNQSNQTIDLSRYSGNLLLKVTENDSRLISVFKVLAG